MKSKVRGIEVSRTDETETRQIKRPGNSSWYRIRKKFGEVQGGHFVNDLVGEK